ncbi:unnamed protein product [Calypogeia fissa]
MPDACFVCRRRGHQARHCPTKKEKQPPVNTKQSKAAPTEAAEIGEQIANHNNTIAATPQAVAPTSNREASNSAPVKIEKP